MAEAVIEKQTKTDTETGTDTGLSRVYEIGYHVSPAVKEEDVEKIVGEIRSEIEKSGGSFIAEGAPSLIKLSYEMDTLEGGKHIGYDRAYFGWLKFEAPSEIAQTLEQSLKQNKNILRHILFRTVREETRARLKAPALREVRRTDTLKAAPRREEEAAAPVSEVDLDKALEDITAE